MTEDMNKQINPLAIFSLLSKESLSRDKIIEELGISKRVFESNLTLLKKSGFTNDVKKGIYNFNTIKTTFTLYPHEKNILAYSLILSHNILDKKNLKSFQSVIKKIYSLAGDKGYTRFMKEFRLNKYIYKMQDLENKISTFEKFINLKQKLRITLTDGTIEVIEPTGLKWKNEDFILSYIPFEKNYTLEIPLEKIIKAIPSHIQERFSKENEVIFELYGKLKQSYMLKEKERIVDYYNDRIVIANSSKDKKALFKRLLRYDVLCRVLQPRREVENFTKIVDEAILNIERG